MPGGKAALKLTSFFFDFAARTTRPRGGAEVLRGAWRCSACGAQRIYFASHVSMSAASFFSHPSQLPTRDKRCGKSAVFCGTCEGGGESVLFWPDMLCARYARCVYSTNNTKLGSALLYTRQRFVSSHSSRASKQSRTLLQPADFPPKSSRRNCFHLSLLDAIVNISFVHRQQVRNIRDFNLGAQHLCVLR